MSNENRPTDENTVVEVGKTFIVKVEGAAGTEEHYEVVKEFSVMAESTKIGLNFDVTQDEPHDTQMRLITHLITEGFIKSKNVAH